MRRTCRLEIPGLTDGTDTFSKAEIEYPVGDKAAHGQYPTEIEILPGDTVWIAFIGGDPRYPIITGSRNPQAGNSVDWRRYHHKNYELICDRIIRLLVGNSVFQLNPDTITGSTTQALTLTIGSTSVSLTPNGLNLTCGGATVQMTPDSIKFNAGRIDLN